MKGHRTLHPAAHRAEPTGNHSEPETAWRKAVRSDVGSNAGAVLNEHGRNAAPGRRGRTPVETDDVTVVIATRNRWQRLAETVAHHRAPVVLVDNASDDVRDVPGVELVRLETNLGAAARNV